MVKNRDFMAKRSSSEDGGRIFLSIIAFLFVWLIASFYNGDLFPPQQQHAKCVWVEQLNQAVCESE